MRPNFLIAGAQKSGTTWLHQMLRHHPDVFMSKPKELGFFSDPSHHGDPAALATYEQHFAKAGSARWRGESTPHYFWHRGDRPWSPTVRTIEPADFVAEVLGDSLERVLLLLRDPVTRAVSAYHHNNARGRVPAGQGIFDCPASMGLVDLGLYSVHWRHWASALGEERLKVYLYDDLAADPQGFLATVMTDLGLHAAPEMMEAARPSRIIHGRRDHQVTPTLPQSDLDRLLGLYEPEIAWVERHTGRSLPAWRDREALVTSFAAPS
ncbi:MAG: sulfotransferase family protein [Nocardioides sp.]